ncbi:phosphatidylinositol-binding protein scs2 [Coemansia javaensis]|uniref:Phosphatidylinositol-binding protein scs2 n=1 Tax=Coemansia javaensis TaxID=2761396 RepID=A0A9W8HGQ6_9FUNG|nr:phosphatidylinositol-binding protein scs2 [Coemansia javaensis]
MALVYEPGDALVFHQPFKSLTNTVLTLTNKNNGPVAFKVKTTAPKQYCVRPNAGRMESGDSIKIQISLQPMKEEPPPDFKCRDKFLIQSIQISPEMESMPMTELWAMVEREAKSSISEKKLRVRYIAPPAEAATGAAAAAATAAAAVTEKAPPAETPPQAAQPPQRISPTNRTLPGPSPLARSVDSYDELPTDKDEKPAKEPAKRQSLADADEPRPQTASNRLFVDSNAPSPADTTALADSAPATPPEAPAASAAELESAKTTIGELRRQLAEYKAQLDKRPAAASASPSRAARPSDSVDGLSMQSVAIVALVAFLVGYFFF